MLHWACADTCVLCILCTAYYKHTPHWKTTPAVIWATNTPWHQLKEKLMTPVLQLISFQTHDGSVISCKVISIYTPLTNVSPCQNPCKGSNEEEFSHHGKHNIHFLKNEEVKRSIQWPSPQSANTQIWRKKFNHTTTMISAWRWRGSMYRPFPHSLEGRSSTTLPQRL